MLYEYNIGNKSSISYYKAKIIARIFKDFINNQTDCEEKASLI